MKNHVKIEIFAFKEKHFTSSFAKLFLFEYIDIDTPLRKTWHLIALIYQGILPDHYLVPHHVVMATWYLVMWPGLSNSSDDRAPVDRNFGCAIFKWVAVTWLRYLCDMVYYVLLAASV